MRGVFDPIERAALLSSRGIGPSVLERLEQVGIDSLAKLRAIGVVAAVDEVCAMLGTPAWGNRRRALEDALIWAVGNAGASQSARCLCARAEAPARRERQCDFAIPMSTEELS